VVFIGSAYGPTLVAGYALTGLADFNRDSHSDYALFAPSTHQTALWYLSGPTFIGSAYEPTPPSGWELIATADFNGNGYPDYLLYNSATRRTAIWYLNNSVFVSAAWGPTNNNTAHGFRALHHNTTGSFNITLGNLAGNNLTTGSNNIDIGNVGVAGESATIRIGTAGTQTATFVAGISGVVANAIGTSASLPLRRASRKRSSRWIKPVKRFSRFSR
jgi:hypothetical protein